MGVQFSSLAQCPDGAEETRDTLKVIAEEMAELKGVVHTFLDTREFSRPCETDIDNNIALVSHPSPAEKETGLGRIIKHISWLKASPNYNVPGLKTIEQQIQLLQHLYRGVDHETSNILRTLAKISIKLNDALESRKPGLLLLFELERELRSSLSRKVTEVLEDGRHYFEHHTARACDMVRSLADKFDQDGQPVLAHEFRVLKSELILLDTEISKLVEKPKLIMTEHLECINQMKNRLIKDDGSLEQERQTIASLEERSKTRTDSISLEENIAIARLILGTKHMLAENKKSAAQNPNQTYFSPPSFRRCHSICAYRNNSELTEKEHGHNFSTTTQRPERPRPRYYSVGNSRNGSFSFNFSIPGVPKLGMRRSSLQFHIPELESFVEGYVTFEPNDVLAVFLSLALFRHIPKMSFLCEARMTARSENRNKRGHSDIKLSKSVLWDPKVGNDSDHCIPLVISLGRIGYSYQMVVNYTLMWTLE